MTSPLHATAPGVRTRPVPGRILAGVAAGLGAAYAGLYLGLMADQGSLPSAWWYTTAIAVPVVLCVVAAATGRVRILTTVAAVLFGGLTLLGVLTIGLLLVPATACAVVAAVVAAPPRGRRTPEPGTRHQEHSS